MSAPKSKKPTHSVAAMSPESEPPLQGKTDLRHEGFVPPAAPPRLVVVRSIDGDRLGLLTQPLGEVVEVQEGPTLPKGVDVTRAAVILNEAARSGQREDLNAMLNDPAATWSDSAQAHALELLSRSALSPRGDLACDGEPLRVVTRYWHSLGSGAEMKAFDQLFDEFDAAVQLNLQLRVENSVSEDGDVGCHVIVLSGEVEVRSVDEIWPAAPGAATSERVTVEFNDTDRVFDDPRWATHRARATWVWIVDEAGDGSAVLVADFFEEGIPLDTVD